MKLNGKKGDSDSVQNAGSFPKKKSEFLEAVDRWRQHVLETVLLMDKIVERVSAMVDERAQTALLVNLLQLLFYAVVDRPVMFLVLSFSLAPHFRRLQKEFESKNRISAYLKKQEDRNAALQSAGNIPPHTHEDLPPFADIMGTISGTCSPNIIINTASNGGPGGGPAEEQTTTTGQSTFETLETGSGSLSYSRPSQPSGGPDTNNLETASEVGSEVGSEGMRSSHSTAPSSDGRSSGGTVFNIIQSWLSYRIVFCV